MANVAPIITGIASALAEVIRWVDLLQRAPELSQEDLDKLISEMRAGLADAEAAEEALLRGEDEI